MGIIDPKDVLDTKLFDYGKASQSAGWIKELINEHTLETEEYGISSFVFRDHRPFHPERFWHFVQHQWPSNIVRSKGIFWLASRPDHAILWSQAGGSSKAEIYGKWWASVPARERRRRPAFMADREAIMKKWDTVWGDRLNELVIIGTQMDKRLLSLALEACLITGDEMLDFQQGKGFADPWPL